MLADVTTLSKHQNRSEVQILVIEDKKNKFKGVLLHHLVRRICLDHFGTLGFVVASIFYIFYYIT